MPRIIDQFGRKRCQKKRKDVNYKLIRITVFQKKVCCAWTVSCQKSVQYIRMLCTGCFILNGIVIHEIGSKRALKVRDRFYSHEFDGWWLDGQIGRPLDWNMIRGFWNETIKLLEISKFSLEQFIYHNFEMKCKNW